MSDETLAGRTAEREASEFARQIMIDAYGYRFCQSFSTFWDGESEPDSFCLTHDQSRRYCREYQAEILGLLTPLIEARDAALVDPADGANEAFTWRQRALHWKADKERAEAEVARLTDALTARSAALNARIDSAEKISKDVMRERDELRATVDRVRVVCDKALQVKVSGSTKADAAAAAVATCVLRALDDDE